MKYEFTIRNKASVKSSFCQHKQQCKNETLFVGLEGYR